MAKYQKKYMTLCFTDVSNVIKFSTEPFLFKQKSIILNEIKGKKRYAGSEIDKHILKGWESEIQIVNM